MKLFLFFWSISLVLAFKKNHLNNNARFDVFSTDILTDPNVSDRTLNAADLFNELIAHCPDSRAESAITHQLIPDLTLDRLPSANCALYLNHLYQIPYDLIGKFPKITLNVQSEIEIDSPEDYYERLKHSPWLHSLKLRPLSIEYEYAEAIATALESHLHLAEFELALSVISGESVVAFIDMMSTLPSLQTLRFICVEMNNQIYRTLTNGLKHHPSLEDLTLQQDFQAITEDNQFEFIAMLETLPLRKLSLQVSGDVQIGYGPLMQLMNHETLEELNLPGFIIDRHHLNLILAITNIPNLKSLNLSQSLEQLTDSEFEQVLTILSRMKHLEGLNLSWNGEHRRVQWSILAQSTSIKSLKLNGNTMNQNSILGIFHAFNDHPSLESLDMSSIPISMSTKDSIRRFVENIPHFKSFNGMSLSCLSSRRFSP